MPFTLVLKVDFNEAFYRASQDIGFCLKVYSEYERAKRKTWENLAGPLLKKMQFNPRITKRFLEGSKMELRLAALFLVKDYWDPSEYYIPNCISLAFDDYDPVVRGVALIVLCRLHKWIEDPTKFLHKIMDTFLPETLPRDIEPKNHLLRQAWEIAEKNLQYYRKRWEELAGGDLPVMLQTRAAAESFLTHYNPNLRLTALRIIDQVWKHTLETAEICKKMAFYDPDTIVRRCALSSLIQYFSNTNDSRIGRILAQVVKDENAEQGLREIAYYGLFEVRGMPSFTKPEVNINKNRFRTPEYVNWSFVNTFIESLDEMDDLFTN